MTLLELAGSAGAGALGYFVVAGLRLILKRWGEMKQKSVCRVCGQPSQASVCWTCGAQPGKLDPKVFHEREPRDHAVMATQEPSLTPEERAQQRAAIKAQMRIVGRG